MRTKQEIAFEHLQEWEERERLAKLGEAAAKRAAEEPEDFELLRDPYLFSLLASDFKKSGLVRERRNALAIYLIATSRLRERPLNGIAKGASAAGKNTLVKSVLNFFPPDEVVSGSSITAHAIDYAGANHLAHKIVYIDEQTAINHPLRQLMSEGRQVRLTSVMENGHRVMKEQVTQGPVACITTTTNNALAIDDETRNLSIWIDESDRQTQAIALAQAQEQRELLSPTRLERWRAVQQRVAKRRNASILLPPWFEDIVKKVLPYGDLRIRRYWPAFLEACKVVALIRAAAWTEKRDDRFTVSFDDFATALCIFDRIIGQTLSRSGGDPEMAIGDLVERLSGGFSKGVAASDLVGEQGIRSLDQAYRALRRARNAGAIYVANAHERNNEKRYLRSPESTFLGTPELIVGKIGLKISGSYVHPISGRRIEYPTP